MTLAQFRVFLMRADVRATAALAALALLGNSASIPLFFGVDFVFGSIPVLLAVALLGTRAAVVVALFGSLYTVFLWGHPWAIPEFVLEALVVGLLYRRGQRNLVLADLTFWLLAVGPIFFIFYRHVLHLDLVTTTVIALKTSLNSIFNALIAGLILLGFRLFLRNAPRLGLAAAGMSNLLFHSLLTAILLAGATPIVVEGHNHRHQLEASLGERLHEHAEGLARRLSADNASTPQQQRAELEHTQMSPDMGLALVAPNGPVIVKKGVVSSIGEAGNTIDVDRGLRFWLPPGEMSKIERRTQGRYAVSMPLGEDVTAPTLVIEESAAPLIRELERHRLKLFYFLAVMTLVGILVARLLAAGLSGPLKALETASRDLTGQIADGKQPVLPSSVINEYGSLSRTLREMATRLSDSFNALHVHQAGLESEVENRTAELNRFKSTLDRALDCVFMFHADTLQFFYVNEGAVRQIGFTRDELMTMHPYDITPEYSEAQFRAAIAPLLAGAEASLTFETTHRHKRETTVPVEIFIQYVAPQGEQPRFVAFVRDITERRRYAQALESVNRRLTLAADAARFGVWDWDIANDHLEWDDWMLRLYGLERSDFSSDLATWKNMVHADDRLRAQDRLEQALRGELDFDIEFRIRRADGQIRHLRGLAVVMRDANRRATRMTGVNYDITEFKRTNTALREHAQHTRAILDNMVDGIITIDQRGTIDAFNPAAERIFGYSAEEVAGRNVKMLMPNPHRDNHDQYLRNYQASGIARIIGIGREVEGRRRDGSLFPMELAVSEIFRDGAPMYVGMVRDITERKRVDRMKSEFVATVSHELRTPLTSITGSLGLIAGGAMGELPAQLSELIGIAHKNSQRLTFLINDLLDMEKLVVGKLQFDMHPQVLRPLIEQAVETNRPYGVPRNVGIRLQCDIGETQAYVDGQRLMQVMSNLLSNAIKFSPDDGMVEVDASRSGSSVRVAITDHGPGVPAEFQPHIFEKFAQADASDTRAKGGTGLGLAITRELVTRMGGRIDFVSETDKGSRFFFELPVWQAQVPRPATESLPASSPLPVTARILVVEDEPDVARLLERILTHAGYRVNTVGTGQAAIDALVDTHYDAITLDLMLPDMHGRDVIARLRERPASSSLPILVISVSGALSHVAAFGNPAYIEWLGKPIDSAQLLDALQKQLVVTRRTPHRVLHVEDDADLHQVIRAMLSQPVEVRHASTLAEARKMIAEDQFDVVLLDIGLPDGSGWDLMPALRTDHPQTRVVVLSVDDSRRHDAYVADGVLLKTQLTTPMLHAAIGLKAAATAPQELA